MMDFAFAYSRTMQWILAVVTFVSTFINYYYIANLATASYGEQATRRQKLLFTFATGTLLNNIWTYAIYFIGGFVEFQPIVYQLVTIPNPLFALLYYHLGVKVLQLPRYKSIHFMTQAFLYCLIIKLVQRFIGQAFFAQSPGPYNYALDAVSLCVCLAVTTLLYAFVMRIVRRYGYILALSESLMVKSLWRSLFAMFCKASLAYGMIVYLSFSRIIIAPLDTFVSLVVIGMALIISVLRTASTSLQQRLNNTSAYINMLTRTIDEFRGVKHDFYNILNTYGGYIAIGNLAKLKAYHESLLNVTTLAGDQIDLNDKMAQNPALLSTIIAKMEYAKRLDVNMRVAVMCDVTDMYIRDIDLCRSLGNLLDNAVEAAAGSSAKSVQLSIERKPDASKLIVITNSTHQHVDAEKLLSARPQAKDGKGIGLSQSRRIFGEYGNCVVQFTSYEKEFSAYINLMPV